MSKYMEINGERFQVIKPRNHNPALTNPFYLRDLWGCCKCPSERKLRIYDYWYVWYRSDDRLSEFGITAYTCQSFTIGCVFQDDDTGVAGYISITPKHNRIYIV